MNDITKRNETLPTNPDTESNPWLAYGNSVAASRIVGKLLKFTKFGEFLAGEEGEEVPMGTELVVHADEFYTGYIKWEENRPVDHRMGRMCDGFEMPKRSELGDTDKELWETNDDGQPRDPWQFSAYLVMYDLKAKQVYTFAASSKGGHKACGTIARAYGQRARMTPDMFPVIRLNWSEYDHSNPRYGKIRNPVFDVVGWTNRSKIDDALQAAVGEATAQAEADSEASDYYEDKPAPKINPPRQASKQASRDNVPRDNVPRDNGDKQEPKREISATEIRDNYNNPRQPTTLSGAARKPRF